MYIHACVVFSTSLSEHLSNRLLHMKNDCDK